MHLQMWLLPFILFVHSAIAFNQQNEIAECKLQPFVLSKAQNEKTSLKVVAPYSFLKTMKKSGLPIFANNFCVLCQEFLPCNVFVVQGEGSSNAVFHVHCIKERKADETCSKIESSETTASIEALPKLSALDNALYAPWTDPLFVVSDFVAKEDLSNYFAYVTNSYFHFCAEKNAAEIENLIVLIASSAEDLGDSTSTLLIDVLLSVSKIPALFTKAADKIIIQTASLNDNIIISVFEVFLKSEEYGLIVQLLPKFAKFFESFEHLDGARMQTALGNIFELLRMYDLFEDFQSFMQDAVMQFVYDEQSFGILNAMFYRLLTTASFDYIFESRQIISNLPENFQKNLLKLIGGEWKEAVSEESYIALLECWEFNDDILRSLLQMSSRFISERNFGIFLRRKKIAYQIFWEYFKTCPITSEAVDDVLEAIGDQLVDAIAFVLLTHRHSADGFVAWKRFLAEEPWLIADVLLKMDVDLELIEYATSHANTPLLCTNLVMFMPVVVSENNDDAQNVYSAPKSLPAILQKQCSKLAQSPTYEMIALLRFFEECGNFGAFFERSIFEKPIADPHVPDYILDCIEKVVEICPEAPHVLFIKCILYGFYNLAFERFHPKY